MCVRSLTFFVGSATQDAKARYDLQSIAIVRHTVTDMIEALVERIGRNVRASKDKSPSTMPVSINCPRRFLPLVFEQFPHVPCHYTR